MIYRLQRILLIIFYTLTMLGLSIPLGMGVRALFPGQLYPLLIAMVLYLVLVVVLGSLIHTISYIPFHLSRAFDPIKNDIASGRIRDVDELGRRITAFTREF